ncbi:MAG: HAD hydrolase-like protein [Gemmatimonadaceae bacterium]
MKLVLFDIDGTLLWTEGAGRRAMEGALTASFGTPGDPNYRYDGKTDKQIVREQMRAAGYEDARIDALMPAVFADYLIRLEAELSSPDPVVHRYDGVLELIDAVDAHDQHVLGLLTGNLAEGARCKLSAVGLDFERFIVGAFGSDQESRPALPAVAIARARESLGLDVPGDRVVIVGDTPSDIECGRSVGARAIAVATGRYTVEQLAAHNPAAVFADLRDTAAVLRAIDDA